MRSLMVDYQEFAFGGAGEEGDEFEKADDAKRMPRFGNITSSVTPAEKRLGISSHRPFSIQETECLQKSQA